MRLKNTLRNMIWNLAGQFALILTGLLLKRVLLHAIGTEKVGLNYLFNDIVGLLSIADLGLTGIISYYLYEPLANHNEVQIIKLMRFFRMAYFVIGCAVIFIGLCMIPFLTLFTGETAIDYSYICIAFLLFLLRNTEGYFFSYKSILPYADQKSYLVSVIDIITNLIYTIAAVFVILKTKNYLYVISLEIARKLVNDFIVINVVNRRYPFVKKKQPIYQLERSEIKKIWIDIKDAFVSKVSKAVISTTDNIFMSTFLGLGVTGLFSNYTLVLYTIQNLLHYLLTSAQASIGNLLVTENDHVVYSVIRKMTFISFYLMSFCGCCLMSLTTLFVALFFGKQYTMGEIVVIVCIYNIFLDVLQKAMIQLSEVGGLFHQIKKINFTSCILNVILSLIGVRFIGITGILLGTLVSRVIEFWLRINVNFKEIIKRNSRNYLIQIVGFLVIFTIELGITRLLCNNIRLTNPYIEFMVYGMIAGIVPLLINTLIYCRTDDFRYMFDLFRILIKRRKASTT